MARLLYRFACWHGSMLTGTIRSISTEKGFGFLQPAAGGPDLFFHCSFVDADFTSLKIGQQVQYEPDESAQQPRAKSVKTGAAAAGDNRPRNVRRGATQTGRSQPVPAHEFGFVTKLRRSTSEGHISSVRGGPEYLFDAASVIGTKIYQDLNIGDYVRFEPQANDDDPKQPLARSVRVTRRTVFSPENLPPQHPRSRGRKPTWR